MSEHPFPQPETQPEPEAPAAKPTKKADPHAGFAVYDLTLTRYVGEVHGTKSAAEKAAPAKVKGHKYETREV